MNKGTRGGFATLALRVHEAEDSSERNYIEGFKSAALTIKAASAVSCNTTPQPAIHRPVGRWGGGFHR
jgi:hypothetical protein